MSMPAEQTEEQIDPTPAPAGHDPYAAFRSPPYRLFAASFVLAVIAQQMVAATVNWIIYEETGNFAMLALIGAVQVLPLLLLALPAGQVADMFPRRRIMATTQLMLVGGTSTLAVLALLGKLHPAVIYAVLLSDAIAFTFHRPARASMIPALVPPRDLANAVTWNSTMFETLAIVGLGMSGMLLSYSSPALVLTLAAVCMGIAMLLTLRLPDYRPATRREPITPASVVAGLRFVFGSKVMLAAMSLDLFAVLFGGATVLLAAFATDRLSVGATGYGWLRAAMPMGALAMAVLTAHLPPMKRAGRAMLLAVAGFGAATVVFGLSTNYWLSFAMLVLCGVFDNISVVVRHTLVQTLTPDAMRGRVSAVNQIFIGSSNELGAVESGLTARWFGPVISVVSGGVMTMLVVAIVALRVPAVRKLGSLRDLKSPDAPG